MEAGCQEQSGNSRDAREACAGKKPPSRRALSDAGSRRSSDPRVAAEVGDTLAQRVGGRGDGEGGVDEPLDVGRDRVPVPAAVTGRAVATQRRA
jgi:hypothetical protein